MNIEFGKNIIIPSRDTEVSVSPRCTEVARKTCDLGIAMSPAPDFPRCACPPAYTDSYFGFWFVVGMIGMSGPMWCGCVAGKGGGTYFQPGPKRQAIAQT